MAKRVEQMCTMHIANSGTVFGFDKSVPIGSLTPNGAGGQQFIAFYADTSNDTMYLKLETANANIAEIVFTGTFLGVDEGATLTNVDNTVFSGIDAGAVAAIAAAVGEASTVYIEFIDTTADVAPFHTSEHGAVANPAVHENGGCVRVGEEPSTGVCYPNKQGGWDNADQSAQHYPDAGSTNEIGGGCR